MLERTTVVARIVPALLVSLAHFAALAWLSSAAHRPVPPVVPPSIAGKLVSAPAPVVAPASPVPTEAPIKAEPPPPKPRPAPREVPKPLPPTPSGPPSPRAVTAPPPEQSAAQPATAIAPAPPAASPAPQAEAKEVAQAVTPPRSDAAHLNNPPPPYPSLSRRLREEGRVVLDVYILADGRVGETRLRRSSGHPRLDEVALDAVRRWRYVPARRGDEPIPFWYVQPVDFRLDS